MEVAYTSSDSLKLYSSTNYRFAVDSVENLPTKYIQFVDTSISYMDLEFIAHSGHSAYGFDLIFKCGMTQSNYKRS